VQRGLEVRSARSALPTSNTWARPGDEFREAVLLDRYGHLMPGNEDEAAGLLDAYLERANTQARLAQVTTDS